MDQYKLFISLKAGKLPTSDNLDVFYNFSNNASMTTMSSSSDFPNWIDLEIL